MSDHHAALIADMVRFENGDVVPDQFDHAAHVRMAFAMTQSYSFDESLTRYVRGLQRLCALVGKPEKFNMTVTVAFLAAVGERCRDSGTRSWEEFAAANRDLFDRRFLGRWYTGDVLGSEIARKTFLLPAPFAGALRVEK